MTRVLYISQNPKPFFLKSSKVWISVIHMRPRPRPTPWFQNDSCFIAAIFSDVKPKFCYLYWCVIQNLEFLVQLLYMRSPYPLSSVSPLPFSGTWAFHSFVTFAHMLVEKSSVQPAVCQVLCRALGHSTGGPGPPSWGLAQLTCVSLCHVGSLRPHTVRSSVREQPFLVRIQLWHFSMWQAAGIWDTVLVTVGWVWRYMLRILKILLSKL